MFHECFANGDRVIFRVFREEGWLTPHVYTHQPWHCPPLASQCDGSFETLKALGSQSLAAPSAPGDTQFPIPSPSPSSLVLVLE